MEALMQIGNRQRNETDPEMLQFLQCGEQVRDRPAPAIQSPHQHQVDLPAASGFQESLAGFSARGPGVHLANLHSNRPTAPGGILPHGAALHRQGLLVIGGNTGIQARSEHFCRLPCLAKNVSRFCLWRSLLYGHFGASPQHDRSRSFSAMQDSSYPMPHPRERQSVPASRGSSRASTPTALASTLPRAAVTGSDSRMGRRRSTRRCESGS